MEWHRDTYTVSTDPTRLDIDVIADFLSNEAYWAKGRPRAVIERSIANSMVFGVYIGEHQVGFARVVTDHATFAWVCDVFVLPDERGKGLAIWLMECLVTHPELADLRRMILGTRDAHELYRKFDFDALPDPTRFMLRIGPSHR